MLRRGKSPVRVVVYLSLALLAAAGVWWAVARLTTTSVEVTRVTRGPVIHAFYATGTVRPHREFPIKAPVLGTLGKVLVDRGDRVKAGQELAIINDPQLKFRADRAAATLEEKKKRADEKLSPVIGEYDARISAMDEMLTTARREHDRVKKMAESNAASTVDLDRAADTLQERISASESLKAQRKSKLYELEREVDVARAEHEMALWDVEQQTLKSPVDGVVLDRPTSPGTHVAVNDVVMRVADVRPENMVMRAAVDEEDVTRCRVGQVVRMSLYAFSGERITGKVVQIYDEADKDRRTFEVDIAFDAPDVKLASGMTGELAFIIAEKSEADVLPATALQNGSIYVVRAGRLVKTSAQVGLKSIERIEVVSGLQPGDLAVISPVGTMKEGVPLRTSEVDPNEAAGLLKAKQQATEGANFKGFN